MLYYAHIWTFKMGQYKKKKQAASPKRTVASIRNTLERNGISTPLDLVDRPRIIYKAFSTVDFELVAM